LLFLLTVPAVPLKGQTADEPERWKTSVDLSYTDQSGNKLMRIFAGGVTVTHLSEEEFEFDAGWRTRYGKSDGELMAFHHLATLAFDFRPEAAWSPFVFADAERDEVKRLDVRLSSGAGVKHTLFSREDDSISLSLAALWSYERIAPPLPPEDAEPPVPPAAVKTAHLARWSLRGRIRHTLRENVTFSHTTFYQPVWDEMANYLLRSDTGFKVLLTERLSLSVEHQIRRDSRPPSGVAPNDLLLTTGLIIEF
jgi:hypothetical protein